MSRRLPGSCHAPLGVG
jgi:hypothetical protein